MYSRTRRGCGAAATAALAVAARRKNRTNLTGKTNGSKAILNALTVHYGGRIAAYIR